MPGLLNLPSELMLMVVDSLDRPSLCQVRLTCKELQEHTWQQFANQHFEEICILPTKGSLDRLEAISKHPRLQYVVESLEICSSIFRFSYYDEQVVGEDDYCGPADRHCKKNALPFKRPNKAWQSCANESVRWMASEEEEEGLEEQLTRIMKNLVLFAVTVTDTNPKLDSGSAFTTDEHLLLGRTEILESTKEDPLQRRQKNRTWDYAGANLHTIVCKKVISALVNSSQSLKSLHLNDIQADHMTFEHITHRELVETFGTVIFLQTSTGFDWRSPYMDINPVPFINFLSAFTDVEVLLLDTNLGSPNIHNRVWRALRMPCLKTLGTSYLCGRDIVGISSLISRCSATLHEVSMTAMINDDDDRGPWQIMVKKLDYDLSLEEFDVTVNERKFEAKGTANVTNKLRELYHWIEDCPLAGG